MEPIPCKKKPPIGLIPRCFAEVTWLSTRNSAIKGAVQRYMDENVTVPQEWLDEYHQNINEAYLLQQKQS